MGVELLLLLLSIFSCGAVFVAWKLHNGSAFRKHWSRLADTYGLSYTPPSWKELLSSDNRGLLQGEWDETTLRIKIRRSKLVLIVKGQGKIPRDMSFTGTNKGILSLVESFVSPSQSTIQTGDKSFDRFFPLQGDRSTALGLFHTPARNLMKQIMGETLTIGNQTTTLTLRKGDLIYVVADNGSTWPNPRLSMNRCLEWMATFTDCCELVRQLSLPTTLEQRAATLAARLCDEIFHCEHPTQQQLLATTLLTDFPEHLEALQVFDRMAQSTSPALRLFALEFQGKHELATVYKAAICEGESVEVRLNAFAWLAQYAPPQVLFQMYNLCESSALAAIRKEAKMQRKKLQSSMKSLQGGQLSLSQESEEAGQMSIVKDGGELSQVDETN